MPDRAKSRIEWTDFSGGINEGPIGDLSEKEVAALVNWYPFGTRLRRRKGVQYITLLPCPNDPVTSVQTYVPVDQRSLTNALDFANATFVAGTPEEIWRYDPISRWRKIDSAAFSSSTEPWHMRQYNNSILMCRRGAGLRVTRPPFESAYAAGIAQPVGANFVLSEQAGGQLFAGTYEYVLTFRNSITKAESGRSDPQRITISADGKWVRLANLTQPPAGSQANEIRIWRSLRVDGTPPVDAFDEYYYIGTVPTGTDVFEDRKAQDQVGSLLGNRTEVPPGNVYLFDIWEERAWLSDGNYVLWSEVGQPEQYFYQNRVLVGPDDGSTVTSLVAWGNRLIIGKTESLYYMLHTGPNEFSREVLSDRHGCWAGHSMRSAEAILLWFGGDGFYRSDGGKPYSITTSRVEKTIAKIPFDKRQEVYAAVYPRNSWYLASIPQEDGRRVILGYNYKTNAWFTFRHFNGPTPATLTLDQTEIHWIREVPGGNLDDGMACVTRDGHIYQYEDGVVDRPGAASAAGPWYDVEIVCEMLTGKLKTLKSDGRQWVRRLRMLCDTTPGSLLIGIVRDTVGYVLRSVLVDPRAQTRRLVRRWKLYNLNSQLLGAENQISIQHTGRTPIEVEGIVVDTTERPDYDQVAS